MTPEERITQLEKQLQAVQEQLHLAQSRIDELEKQEMPPRGRLLPPKLETHTHAPLIPLKPQRAKQKFAGWLKFDEIAEAWAAYLKEQGFTVHERWQAFLQGQELTKEERLERVELFFASFSSPRLPVLREKDKRYLTIWHETMRVQVQHPEQWPFCNVG